MGVWDQKEEELFMEIRMNDFGPSALHFNPIL